MTGIKCVIFDFGGVIGKPQDREYLEKMIQISGLEEAAFRREYRTRRHEYDRGVVTADEYWNNVLADSPAKDDGEILGKLIEYDVASWTRINETTKSYILGLLQKGIPVAVLSNINVETVRHLATHQPWIAGLDTTIFSCELKRIKPEREIYEICARNVEKEPHECLFIDDTYLNVEAARNFGMNALLFESAEQMMHDIETRYELLSEDALVNR